MRKLASSAAGAVLLLGSLAACGDDGGGGESGGADATESYCDAVEAAKDQFDALEVDSPDFAEFDQVFETLKSLGDDAPDEVADDWEVLTAGFDTLEQALSDAGLTLEDLSNPEALQELDPAAMQELTEKFATLDSDEFSDAGDAIAKHAQDECGVDIDGSDSESDSGSGSDSG